MKTNFFSDQEILLVKDIPIKIEAHLGHFTGVDYFQVLILSQNEEVNLPEKGLLRVGVINSGLQKELQLRELLGKQRFLTPLLAHEIKINQNHSSISTDLSDPNPKLELSAENFAINNQSEQLNSISLENDYSKELESLELCIEDSIFDKNLENSEILDTETSINTNNDYLEEEKYPEKFLDYSNQSEVLLLLTKLPLSDKTLEYWLSQKQTPESALLIASQLCQLFRLISQHSWCVFSILPQFIQIGTPLEFFDLTNIHPINQALDYGLISYYSPPELAYSECLQETTSSYIVGIVLLQALFPEIALNFFKQDRSEEFDLELPLQPKIYQILKITLSLNVTDRFTLEQLLELLIETRRLLQESKVRWQIASQSTIGLSLNRLHNEDSYGIKQSITNYGKTVIIAAIADGMGGLSEGEVASKIAIETILNSSFSEDFFTNSKKRENWLFQLLNDANYAVTQNVSNGGTTLSVLLAFGRDLHLAHVGDTRIYLLRRGILCQLTEDHSMVSMLLSSGQISYNDSLKHPDRNVLTKSLGSKLKLSQGYVQSLSYFDSSFSLLLEDQDLLLLCSDGIWDLISPEVLVDSFEEETDLQLAVDQIINLVLKYGANDNATLIALRCFLESSIL